MTWAELIERLEADLLARQGASGIVDEKAWEMAAYLLHHRGRLLRAQWGLSPEELQDVIQDVLLKLQSLATMHRVRSAGSAEGYLFVMMRNAARDRVRRRTIERDLLIDMPEGKIAAVAAERPAFPGNETLRLRRVLKSLDHDERELLHMRFWQNMSFQEIAEAMGISYSAAAVRMFRLLKRAEKLMDEL